TGIKKYAESFKSHLKTSETLDNLYKYENLTNFRAHWDIDELDFYEMYNKSFQSKMSNVLWGGSRNSAKSIMLEFIKLNKEFCRSMFKDLFDERKDLAMRINRFVFHCDQMLLELQNTTDKYVSHKHNPSVVSLYLCFNDPAQYCIIDHNKYSKALHLLEARSIPEFFELERSLKLSKGLLNIMSKDEEFSNIYQSKFPDSFKCEFNMLMVHDFYHFISK
ncbi:MAG: hypothetical protein KJN84_09600, partial [Bacteroidia bacterium]|nr:hypothetical protein [Bacteroidia bacterium]